MKYKLYYGGNIITMEETIKTAEAVLIQGDTIIDVGKKHELIKKAGKNIEYIDIKGTTMLPAFIDAHSHFSSYANSLLQVSLKDCQSFSDIQKAISDFIKKNKIQQGEWITAQGYDHNVLSEKEHPKKEIIDKAAPENPVVISHISGHVGVFNSKALNALKISCDTVAPKGGKIEKVNGIPTGYMEENAFIFYLSKIPMKNISALMKAYEEVQYLYASYGITTVQEGMFSQLLIPIYKELLKKNMLILDVVGYVDIHDDDAVIAEFKNHINMYNSNFKIGGYKTFLDGSPQGKTAWLTEPYCGDEDDYCGYGILTDDEIKNDVQKAITLNMQLLAHCNGDMAAEQYIKAWEASEGNYRKTRPVIIHAQLLQKQQLKRIKELGLTPSFFIAHVYHWGDTHLKNLGKKRASQISCANSALKEGILFTFHQDAPVIKPDMLETIWCAVNRKTKQEVSLGSEECIPVYEALKAVTINAAWQYHEEDSKGSIIPGKKANFVILDRNPLEIPKNEIRNIRVIKTIKNGEIIFNV